MNDTLTFLEYSIEPLLTEREVNYIVHKDGQYLFRLVPSLDGFECSQLDKALGNVPDEQLVEQISNWLCAIFA